MAPILEKLIKVLELERQQGFVDRAVIGGLEPFVLLWSKEASGLMSDAVVRIAVGRLRGYGELGPDERRQRVEAVLEATAEPAAGAAPAVGSERKKAPPTPEPKPRTDAPAPKPAREASSPKPDPVGSGRPASADEPSLPGSATSPISAEDDPVLDRPVIHVRGIGKKATENLARLGVSTIRDLLLHAPTRYEDYSHLKPINELRRGEDVTVVGTVWDVRHRKGRAGRDVLTVVLADTTATVACTFFNQPYLEREFRQGRQVVISGRPEPRSGRLVFSSPQWEPLDKELVHTGRLVPIYPLTQGVTQRWLRARLKTVVDRYVGRLGDPLPARLRRPEDLPSRPQAIKWLHFPTDLDQAATACGRLAFDELLALQLWARQRRRAWRAQPGVALAAGRPALSEFVASLPFTLTGAQARCLEEIAADLDHDAPMVRLLQGDVGSGKTAVAAGAIVMCVAAGFQAALMAPTEILAEQHARSVGRFLREVGYVEFDPDAPPAEGPTYARLVGSMRPSEKAKVVAALAEGRVDLVIGTHAVIQDHVAFARLGLSVVDEQHRFGVVQRSELSLKGQATETRAAPHVLVMTATPIPRTLAMAVNADLDQSVIDELPPGRKAVRTLWLQPRERERAYGFIRRRVESRQQAYVVCPLVEDSDAIRARAAVAEHERLATEVFPDLRVELVHGRMRPADKEAVMARFYAGDVDVLVATSVIEVGVDVPNATVMLVEGADRFGLAQLHQLRGRVGRGKDESACLLLADDPSPTAAERLEALTRTNDGLELAMRDLDLRGPGDYFGVQQSGVVDRFRFARHARSEDLVRAQRVAARLMEEDPELAADDLTDLRQQVEGFHTAAGRV